MKPYTCKACLPQGEKYVEAPAIDSSCSSCGELAPQMERVLAGLIQVLRVTPVPQAPVPVDTRATSPDSAVFTLEETCRELGCKHVSTVYRLVKQGKLKAAKKAGKKCPMMIFKSSVYAFRGDAKAPKVESAPTTSPAQVPPSPTPAPAPDFVSPLRALLKKGA